MVCGGLWWFMVVCGGLRWFVMVCGGLSYTSYSHDSGSALGPDPRPSECGHSVSHSVSLSVGL